MAGWTQKKNEMYLVIWGFEFLVVNGREVSGSSPLTSPVSSSMVAFSPEVVEVNEEPKLSPKRKMVLAVIVAPAMVGVLMLSLLVLWIYHRRTSYRHSDKNSGFPQSRLKGGFKIARKTAGWKGFVLAFEYKVLESVTNNFEESNVVGIGGFGCVYKARLANNQYIAVKKVHDNGEDAEREFENEGDLLSKIHHPNVIALLGYCILGETRFLVYELMDQGSLENQLHGPSHGSALTWDMRMKIALDVARGLEFLHEHCNPPVIHRDLKSSNVLLDSNFNAKLSDFGLAVVDGMQNKSNIKLSGTLGYVAPEYLLDGKLTDKSDVYAFGVVLLELLLGRKPMEKFSPPHCQSIVTWAIPQLTDRLKLPTIVDPVIRDTMDLKHLFQVAAVAVLCVQTEPSYRPLITDVLHSLIPLVPAELGGSLRSTQHARHIPPTP
ncbi:putative receptor-like protein [Drosera capensis]